MKYKSGTDRCAEAARLYEQQAELELENPNVVKVGVDTPEDLEHIRKQQSFRS